MTKLASKVAIVTGGSRGIGKGIARKLAEEGAKVALLDTNESALNKTVEELRDKGFELTSYITNVADPEQVESAVKEVASQYGKVDILVNNAGILRNNLLSEMTDDDWEIVMDVHLKGSFNCARAVQKYMVENQFGRIVNISSTNALGGAGKSNYSAAKAGIQGLTKTLAIELGRYGITVNSVAPGLINTQMSKDYAKSLGMSFDDFVHQSAAKIPVGRIGKPVDIAHAVAFFCEEASSFINGQVIYVAGGPKA
ncbi:SDR family NAD(P)-dependent oxidoreductase [Neobacillus niacini]|uniref:SDR family NAD(P)-dependent oxidoreductase n=1 Tax=Neobacillus niacini TaxID=86668 RepID=UPI003B012AC2